MEENWLKYGFKENGELVCLRMLAESKLAGSFFYTESEGYKEVKNPKVVRITKEGLEKLNN